MVEDTIEDVATLRALVKDQREERAKLAARVVDLEMDLASAERYTNGLECRLEALLGAKHGLAVHDANAITVDEMWGAPS